MAFNCDLTQGQLLSCSSIGGVEIAYIGEWDEATLAFDSCGTITGITSSPGLSAYTFYMDSEHGGLNQTLNASREAGTVFFEAILTTKFVGFDCNRRKTLVELSRSPLFAVVKSVAGDYYALGIGDPSGRANGGTASVGTAYGDFNGTQIDLSFKSANGAYLISSALIGTTITLL
jgi:hypothetical protein